MRLNLLAQIWRVFDTAAYERRVTSRVRDEIRRPKMMQKLFTISLDATWARFLRATTLKHIE